MSTPPQAGLGMPQDAGAVEARRQAFLSHSAANLSRAGFQIFSGPAPGFDLIAVRKKFEASKFGSSHAFFAFATFSGIDLPGLHAFSERCFQFMDQGDAGLPRGLGKAVTCFPVVLVPSVDPAVGQSVRTVQATKHWAGFEMPVLVDIGTGELYFLQKTPMWGAAYYRGFRKLVEAMLGP